MTNQDGANAGGEANSNNATPEQTVANVKGGGNNTELEALKKELASRDKKIADLMEVDKAKAVEAEKQRLANLSSEERLAELEGKLKRQDSLSSYMGLGLSNEQSLKIVDASNEIEKATLLKEFTEQKTLETFKAQQLSNVPKEPQPKDKITTNIIDEQKQWLLNNKRNKF